MPENDHTSRRQVPRTRPPSTITILSMRHHMEGIWSCATTTWGVHAKLRAHRHRVVVRSQRHAFIYAGGRVTLCAVSVHCRNTGRRAARALWVRELLVATALGTFGIGA